MIQIELRPALQSRYAELAGERGLPLEQYIAERLEILEPNVQPPCSEPEMTPEERAADIDAWLKRLTKYSYKKLLLPESAFTRESFYQDHD